MPAPAPPGPAQQAYAPAPTTTTTTPNYGAPTMNTTTPTTPTYTTPTTATPNYGAPATVTPVAVTATATTTSYQTPQVIHQTPAAVPTQADLAHMTPEQQMAHLQMMQKKQQAAAPQRKVIPVKRDLAGPQKEKESKKGSKGGIRAFFGFGKKKKPVVVEHTVSDPFNMKHNVHVDFTTKTGFVGLPSEWESTLLSSGVNKNNTLLFYCPFPFFLK